MQWWAYKHINGSVQVKRYFSKLDIDEAKESPFVYVICESFFANNRKEALETAKKLLLIV